MSTFIESSEGGGSILRLLKTFGDPQSHAVHLDSALFAAAVWRLNLCLGFLLLWWLRRFASCFVVAKVCFLALAVAKAYSLASVVQVASLASLAWVAKVEVAKALTLPSAVLVVGPSPLTLSVLPLALLWLFCVLTRLTTKL